MGGPTSRNLEVISKSDEESVADRPLERRRVPRLNVSKEQFRLTETGKIFSIIDLSMEGMAIRIIDPNDLALFTLGRRHAGSIRLQESREQVTVQVRHIRRDRAGIEFVDPLPQVKKRLEEFLSPENLGAELRLMPSSRNQNHIWYHGHTGADFLVWSTPTAESQWERLILYFHQSYVQWDAELGLSTGVTQTSDEPTQASGVVSFETLLLESDQSPDKEKLEVAKTLIMSSNVPDNLKNHWKSQLNEH